MNPLCPKPAGAAARLLFFLVGRVPWIMLHGLALAVAWIRSRYPGRELEWFNLNLERIFQLPAHSSFARSFRRQVFYHQAISVLESIRAVSRPRLCIWEGLDEFGRALAEAGLVGGQEGESASGGLVITAHLGCWELVGSRVAALLPPGGFFALAKPSRSPFLTRLMLSLRASLGIRVLWTGTKTLQRQMLKALSNGGVLGFVMDQKPAGRVGPVAEFFHHPTEFVSGPAKMACHTGLGVCGIYCLRTGPMRFRLVASVLASPGHQIKDPDALTRTMVRDIERMIRLYPEQWCWNYRRWRFDKNPSVPLPPVRL